MDSKSVTQFVNSASMEILCSNFEFTEVKKDEVCSKDRALIQIIKVKPNLSSAISNIGVRVNREIRVLRRI